MAREAACLCQDLLISTLHGYDLEISSLNLLEDYLSNHKKRIKVDSFISSWEDILSGVLQGFCSIRAMFLILKTVYFNGYANDNTCFVVTGKIKDLIRHLEEVAGNIISFLQIK